MRAACLLVLAGCLIPKQEPKTEPVTLDSGRVRGAVAGETHVFRGIPYAAPPVGQLRWRPPEPVAPWQDVRDATEFGPPCMQGDEGAEDCLTLNVWTPSAKGPPRPVMVYLHGGDNVSGGAANSSDGDYDGEVLATRTGAVVVTANYRLGPFGFLPHPAFRAESAHQSTGNYGLLDQLAALEWVKRNIAAFGGDPANVMLFGQSAGSYDTCALVTSPLAKGLFHRALMQSGPCWVPKDADRDALVELVSREVGCTGADAAACLREVPASRLAATVDSSARAAFTESHLVRYKFYPNVDGWVLPVAPLEALRAGTHNHVPMVFGTTADELQTLFGPALKSAPITTEAKFEEWITAVVTDSGLARRAAARYRPEAYGGSYDEAFLKLMGDVLFHCRVRQAARAASASQSEPVYRYLYAHVSDDARLKSQKAGHGMEVPYIWGGHDFPSLEWRFSEREVPFSQALSGYWGRFAASGDPNGGDGEIAWPRYDAASDRHLRLEIPIAAAERVREADCDFWDAESP